MNAKRITVQAILLNSMLILSLATAKANTHTSQHSPEKTEHTIQAAAEHFTEEELTIIISKTTEALPQKQRDAIRTLQPHIIEQLR